MAKSGILTNTEKEIDAGCMNTYREGASSEDSCNFTVTEMSAACTYNTVRRLIRRVPVAPQDQSMDMDSPSEFKANTSDPNSCGWRTARGCAGVGVGLGGLVTTAVAFFVIDPVRSAGRKIQKVACSSKDEDDRPEKEGYNLMNKA